MNGEASPASAPAGLQPAGAFARLFTPQRLIMSVFFLHAVGLSNFWPRVPDLQSRLAVGPGELSIAMLGMPLATVFAVPFAGSLIAKFGARRMLTLALPLTTLSIALPGWSFDVATLFAALFLIGLTYPVVDIAMNVEADRIERTGGRRIMSTCHGCWSVGSVTGGLVATAFAGAGVSPGWHLVIVALAILPLAFSIPQALPELDGGVRAGRVALALPSRGIIGLCFFLFGTLMVEVTARNWGAVFVTDVLEAPAVYAGLTYSAFALAMAVARFAGDRLVDRFGPVAVARVSCLIALVGLALVVFAASPIQVVIGFAAAGLGVATGFPLSATAAAGRGDLPPAVNVAALQVIGVGAFLFTPPLIGGIAELAGLRVGIAVVLPMILASLLLAGELRRKAASPPGG